MCFSDINTNRSLETASLHQTQAAAAAVAAAAAASMGSIYPRHPANAQFKFAPHLIPAAPPSSIADLRSRLLVDARSAFSCVRPTSRDRDRQPEVGACDVTRPTTTPTTHAAAKPRIWCIADVATSPDNCPSRPRVGVASSPTPSNTAIAVGANPV